MFRPSALDRVMPHPRLCEVDHVDLAVPPARAWAEVRHGDLAVSALARALFTVRTLPDRLAHRGAADLRIDALRSTPDRPGFQVLADDGGSEVVVGAIGKVCHLQIPFVHVADADEFRAFAEPQFVKVAWALRVTPRGDNDARVTLELRVDATDADSWARFRRYFAVVGPASRFVRSCLFATLAERLGTPEEAENGRTLPGDALLEDARAQLTNGITIHARPGEIWPWLVQMGCGRAGFEVLALDPERSLVLGALYDADVRQQRAFAAERPEHFWQVTWSFVLEPIDGATTRLHVRARAAFSRGSGLRMEWIRPVHSLMETVQLQHLAARAEGRLPRDDWRDILAGASGAAIMVAAFLTPWQREARSHWGLSEALASRRYPGDELVVSPRWGWTHGVEIDAAAEAVWPWVAQLGADRGGFYSYQWLENLAGCALRNADTVHADWALEKGDLFRLHPDAPPLHVVEVARFRYLVVSAPADATARAAGRPWAEASWLFHLEPLSATRCRLVSRYRCATSEDVAMRLTMGPSLLEPVGFAMDRRMLLGIKARAEDVASGRPLRNVVRRRTTPPS